MSPQIYNEHWDQDLPERVAQAYYELDDDDLHLYASALRQEHGGLVGRQLVATTHALAFAVATISMMKAKVNHLESLYSVRREGGKGRRISGIREARDPRRP